MSNRYATLVIALVLFTSFLAPGSAPAAEDLPATGRLGPAKLWRAPLVIPAAEFRNDGGNTEGFYQDPAGHLVGTGSNSTMFAPVYLPDGVTVTAMTAHVYDNTNS